MKCDVMIGIKNNQKMRCGNGSSFWFTGEGYKSRKSDIDLAVRGGDAARFAYDVDEEVRTLLMFDVVDLEKGVSSQLQEEIDRDGVILYEKV